MKLFRFIPVFLLMLPGGCATQVRTDPRTLAADNTTVTADNATVKALEQVQQGLVNVSGSLVLGLVAVGGLVLVLLVQNVAWQWREWRDRRGNPSGGQFGTGGGGGS